MITESQKDGGIVPLPSSKRTQTCEDIHVSNELNSKQKSEIKEILKIYEDTFTDVPKRTNVLECEIRLTTYEPV